MPDIADPLIQGMMAGLRFKEVFQRAKQQREELDMRKQALAEARAQRERQNELMDLKQRIAMTDAGIRPMTPEDEFRSSLKGVPRFRADETGGMSQIGSGVSGSDVGDRILNYRGERLVMPSEAEKRKRLEDALLAKAFADIGAKEGTLEKYGQSFQLEPGVATTVLPSEIPAASQRRSQIERDREAAEASRALAEYRRRPAPPQRPWGSFPTTNKKGDLAVTVVGPEGARVYSGPEMEGISTPKQAAGGQGTLSGLRFEESKDKRRQDAIDKRAKEFHDLELKESEEWAKAEELEDAIAGGIYMLGTTPITPADKKAKASILTSMKGSIERHKKQANTLMKQKKQAYEELVKIGGATPMGGSPVAAQTQSLDQRLEGTPLAAAAPTPAPAPTSGPKLGDVRKHLGVDYKFDGTKWVRQ